MKYLRPILTVFAAILGLTVFNLQASYLGVALPAVLRDFGESRAAASGFLMFSLLASLPFLLAAGIVYDWRGGRWVVIAGSIVTILASVGLATANSSILFAVWYCLFTVGGALFGGVVPLVMLANWFVRLRGIFIGVVVAIASLGTLAGPPLAGFLVQSFGWRSVFLLGFLPLVIIPFAVFIKRRPEDTGSTPDFGMGSDKATLAGRWSPLAAGRYRPGYDARSLWAGFKAYSWSFGTGKGIALGVLAGLLFAAVTVIGYGAKGGTTTFLVISMVDAGASMSAAAMSATAVTIAIPIGALVLGVLSDFLHARFCLAASLVIFGAGMLLFTANPRSPVALPLMGLGQGGLVCLVTVLLADYFGRGVLGSLRAVAGVLMAAAGAVSPVLLGYVYDVTAGFSTGFIGLGVAVLVCAVLAIFMWPPRYEKLPPG